MKQLQGLERGKTHQDTFKDVDISLTSESLIRGSKNLGKDNLLLVRNKFKPHHGLLSLPWLVDVGAPLEPGIQWPEQLKWVRQMDEKSGRRA